MADREPTTTGSGDAVKAPETTTTTEPRYFTGGNLETYTQGLKYVNLQTRFRYIMLDLTREVPGDEGVTIDQIRAAVREDQGFMADLFMGAVNGLNKVDKETGEPLVPATGKGPAVAVEAAEPFDLEDEWVGTHGKTLTALLEEGKENDLWHPLEATATAESLVSHFSNDFVEALADPACLAQLKKIMLATLESYNFSGFPEGEMSKSIAKSTAKNFLDYILAAVIKRLLPAKAAKPLTREEQIEETMHRR